MINKANQQFIVTTLLALPLFSTFSLAQTDEQRVAERLNDQRSQNEITHVKPHTPAIAPKAVENSEKSANSISITKEELAKHPDLVVRALIPAVSQNNADHVALLFPIYEGLSAEYHDPILLQWSKAILAKKERNFKEAIRLYREILAQQSELNVVRLQLAITLFEDHQLEASEDQFRKLRAEPLPAEISQGIDLYLNAINQRDRWTFGGGMTYLRDPNINNAPTAGTRYGNWIAPERQSAEGIGFNFNIGKKWSWGNGFFNELRLDGSGKYYWDNKKYNEASGRGSVGIGFENARYSLTLLPFMEQSLYAGGNAKSESLKRFSKASGATLESSYWFSPQWRLSGNYEYAEQRYADRKHLNGNSHFISTGLTYLASAKQYWFANLNYNRTATRDKDDSFFRRGVSLGWGQEWGYGFSSRIALNYGIKQYKAPMPIFNITQRNKEYGATVSLWHRAIHFWGITPRLTYSYNRTKSNHVFYSYDKHRAFIEVSKQF